jgi:hypothetical protein
MVMVIDRPLKPYPVNSIDLVLVHHDHQDPRLMLQILIMTIIEVFVMLSILLIVVTKVFVIL